MTESWGEWAHAADPDILPASTVKPSLRYVCERGHSLIKIYPAPEESDGQCVAVWNSQVYFESPGATLLSRQPHVGVIPEHIVSHDQLTGEPAFGGLIGGIIGAQCRCQGKYFVHTRNIEMDWNTGKRGRAVVKRKSW